MKNRYLLGIALSGFSVYATENNPHVSYILEKAREQFDSAVNNNEYRGLERSLKQGLLKLSSLNQKPKPIKLHTASKSGNTLLVYGEVETGGFGYFDSITLKNGIQELRDEKSFQKFSLPIITAIAVCSKNLNVKLPRTLIDIILKYGYQNYALKVDSPRYVNWGINFALWADFCTYQASKIFVDDQKNIAIVFKDNSDRNLIYAQTPDKYNICTYRLIVPKYVDGVKKEDFIVNSEICKKGTISNVSIENCILHLTKDGNEYSVLL